MTSVNQNAVNANAQGVQYLNNGVWTGIDGSTMGFVLKSNGTGVAPTFQPASGGSGIVTLNGDSGYGSATGTTVTLNTGGSNANGTAVFQGSGATMTLVPSPAATQTTTGWGVGCLTASAGGVGATTAFGYNALNACTSVGANGVVAIGSNVMSTCTTANGGTVAIGQNALLNFVGPGGGAQVVIGNGSLNGTGFNGSYNTVVGAASGTAYVGTESSNILLGAHVTGTASESNALRIGKTTGTNPFDINQCFIQGIYSQDSSGFTSPLPVYVDTTNGQLGYGPAAYTTGTFVPTVTFGGTPATLSSAAGKYTQAGNLVTFSVNVAFSAVGAGVGDLVCNLTGLPSSVNAEPAGVCTTFSNFITFDAGYTALAGAVIPNTATVSLAEYGSGVTSQNIANTNCASNTAFRITGSYWTS